MKKRDLIYNIADPKGALSYQKQYFFYQQTDQKQEIWKISDTHSLAKISPKKVSQYSFDASPDLLDAELNTLIRSGGFSIDLDSKDNIDLAINEGRDVVNKFLSLGVPEKAIIVAMSGSKGIYIHVDSRVFGSVSLSGDRDIMLIQGEMANCLFPSLKTLDLSIYKGKKKGRLLRVLNVKRDNNKYRTVVGIKEFLSVDSKELVAMTEAPGKAVEYSEDLQAIEKLEKIFTDSFSLIDLVRKKKISVPKPIHNNDRTAKNESLIVDPNSVSASCLKIFNNEDLFKINPILRYNDWSFLVASIDFYKKEELVLESVMGFVTNAKSDTYPTANDRMNHFLDQRSSLSSADGTKPFCNAIRKALKTSPCAGCPKFSLYTHFDKRSYNFGAKGTYTSFTNDKGQVIENIISNIAPIYQKRKKIFNENGKTVEVIHVFDILIDQFKYVIELNNDELNSNDKIEKIVNLETHGRAIFSVELKKTAVVIFTIARTDEPYLPDENLYTKIGFIENGTYIFRNVIIKNGISKFYKDPIVVLPSDSKANELEWVDLSKEVISKSLLESIRAISAIHEDKICLPALAIAVLPIVNFFINDQHLMSIMIVGPSGDSKSTATKFTMSLWGNFYKLGSLISASWTPYSIQIQGAYFGDSLFPIDDIKQSQIRDMRGFRQIIQNHSDGSSRGRLSSDSKLNVAKPITAQIILNGEDVFAGGETSIVGRQLELEVTKVVKDSSKIEILKKHAANMRGVLPHFLKWLQLGEKDFIDEMYRAATIYYSDAISIGENKERVVKNLANSETAFNVFVDWLKSDLKWDVHFCDDLKMRLRTNLLQIGQRQALLASIVTFDALYLKGLSELISSARVKIDGLVEHADLPPSMPVVGRLFTDHFQTDHIYIFPEISLNAVRDHFLKMGTQFPASTTAVAMNLKKSGSFVLCDADKNTKRRRFQNTNSEYWVFSKSLLNINTSFDSQILAISSDDKNKNDVPL